MAQMRDWYRASTPNPLSQIAVVGVLRPGSQVWWYWVSPEWQQVYFAGIAPQWRGWGPGCLRYSLQQIYYKCVFTPAPLHDLPLFIDLILILTVPSSMLPSLCRHVYPWRLVHRLEHQFAQHYDKAKSITANLSHVRNISEFLSRYQALEAATMPRMYALAAGGLAGLLGRTNIYGVGAKEMQALAGFWGKLQGVDMREFSPGECVAVLELCLAVHAAGGLPFIQATQLEQAEEQAFRTLESTVQYLPFTKMAQCYLSYSQVQTPTQMHNQHRTKLIKWCSQYFCSQQQTRQHSTVLILYRMLLALLNEPLEVISSTSAQQLLLRVSSTVIPCMKYFPLTHVMQLVNACTTSYQKVTKNAPAQQSQHFTQKAVAALLDTFCQKLQLQKPDSSTHTAAGRAAIRVRAQLAQNQGTGSLEEMFIDLSIRMAAIVKLAKTEGERQKESVGIEEEKLRVVAEVARASRKLEEQFDFGGQAELGADSAGDTGGSAGGPGDTANR